MKPTLFFLPMVAFFLGLIGTVLSSNPQFEYAFVISWCVALFLVLLWVKLDWEGFVRLFNRKGVKYGASSGTVILLGIGVFIGVATLSQRPTFKKRIDLTEAGVNTLSQQSLKIIDNIKRDQSPVEMTAFFRNQTTEANFRNLFDLYLESGLVIKSEYLDIQAEPVRAMQENVTSANTVIFKMNEIESRITIFTEEKITNALIKVLKGKSKKIYFLSGHGEGGLDSDQAPGYSFVNRMLKNDNYEVSTLSLSDSNNIPNDANLIVLAGPKYDLKPHEADLLEVYMRGGGGVLMALDAVTSIPNIISLAEKFGVKVNSDLVLLGPEDPRVKHYGQNNAFITDFEDFHLITKDFASQSKTDLILPFTRSIEQLNVDNKRIHSEVIARASSKMIKITEVNSQNDLGDIVESRVETGSFPVMVVSRLDLRSKDLAKANNSKNRQVKQDVIVDQEPNVENTRLVVVGSASFLKNQVVQASVISQDLIMNIVNYILQDEDYISIRPKENRISSVSVSTTSSQISLLVICLLYPIFFLLMGGFSWLRRRNI